MGDPKTVILKGNPIRKEREAHEEITPGHLLELRSDGKVQKHSNDGGDAIPIFAVEQDFIGEGIDDVYAAEDEVQYNYFRPGDEIYAWLDDGSAEVNPGDFLMSKGTGALTKFVAEEWDSSTGSGTIHPLIIVGVALETVDPGANDERIRVEVI